MEQWCETFVFSHQLRWFGHPLLAASTAEQRSRAVCLMVDAVNNRKRLTLSPKMSMVRSRYEYEQYEK